MLTVDGWCSFAFSLLCGILSAILTNYAVICLMGVNLEQILACHVGVMYQMTQYQMMPELEFSVNHQYRLLARVE